MNQVFGIFEECFIVPGQRAWDGETNETEMVFCHAFGVSADKQKMVEKCAKLNADHFTLDNEKPVYKVLPISLI